MDMGTAPPAGDSAALYGIGVSPLPGQPSAVPVSPCIVCGTRSATPLYVVEGLESRLHRCDGCGLGMLHPPPPDRLLSSFYPPDYYGTGPRKFRAPVEGLVRLVGGRHARMLSGRLAPGARILDVGCGRGVTLAALADAGFEMHGFDRSQEAVEGIDPRVRVRVAPSLEAARYPAAWFDQAVLWHVLEHVPDPCGLIREIHRILKPGGRLVVAVPNFSSLQARWAGAAWFHLDLPRHLFHFPAACLLELLRTEGFECGRMRHFSLRQNPFGWIQSLLNKLPWLPRNGLYVLLHDRRQPARALYRPWQRWQMRLLFYLLAPAALAMSVLAAAMRSGATVHVVATRSDAVGPAPQR